MSPALESKAQDVQLIWVSVCVTGYKLLEVRGELDTCGGRSSEKVSSREWLRRRDYLSTEVLESGQGILPQRKVWQQGRLQGLITIQSGCLFWRLEIALTTDFLEPCLPEIYKYCIEHARMVSFQLMGTCSDGTPETKALFQDHKTP